VMSAAVTPAYFVPDSIKADVLFANMKRRRYTLAVVVDEYGGMVGIVTINDLIEQLVGSLPDADPVPADGVPFLRKIDERTWEVFGNIDLRIIEKATGLEFDNDDVYTITGIVYDALGIIPKEGKQNIEVDVAGLHVHILTVEDHQIVHCRIRLAGQDE